MYTLDTNAIIYYVKDDTHVVQILRDILANPAFPLYISTITEAELFSFFSLTDTEVVLISNLLRSVSIIPVDSHIARMAGRIRATYHLKLADSVIAATAIFTGSTIITRNTRDFKKIPTLSIHPL